MKKSRVFSILLAAVMAATSLFVPVGAESTDGIEMFEADLSDPANYTGELTASRVGVSADTNTYLRVGARDYASQQYNFKFTFKTWANVAEGDELELSFSHRAPVDGTETPNAGFRWMHKSSETFWATNEWQAGASSAKLTVKKATNGSLFVETQIRGIGVITAVCPIEIDNIVLKNADGVAVYSNDFEPDSDSNNLSASFSFENSDNKVTETAFLRVDAVDVAEGSTVAETDYTGAVSYEPDMTLVPGRYTFSFDSRMSYFFINSDHNSEEYEYEYQKKLGDGTDRTSVTPDKGVRYHEHDGYSLSTGAVAEDQHTTIYHALYKNNTKTAHANYRDIKVAFVAGGKELVSATETINDKWENFTYEFEIFEPTTLDAVSFGGTGLAYDNDAFDIMNVSLKLEESYLVVDTERFGLFEADLSDPTNYETNGLTVEQGMVSSTQILSDTNSYLRADARKAANVRYYLRVVFNEDTTVAAGDILSLTFSLRSPIDGVEVTETAWRFEHATATVFTATNEWGTYTTENVTVKEAADGKYIEVGIFGKNDIKQVAPLEIDNVVLTDANGNDVYVNDFESIDKQSSMGRYTWKSNGVTYTPVSETTYLHVGAVAVPEGSTVEEMNYAGSVTYDPDLLLEPGRYTLSFDSRMSYFFINSDHNSAEYEYEYQKKLGDETDRTTAPDKGVRAAELGDGYITNTWGTPEEATSIYHILYKSGNSISHSNYRDIKVALKAGDSELVSETVEIDDTWGKHAYEFVITEPTTIDALSFGGTGLAYDNDAFDLMNVCLKYEGPVEPETVYGDADGDGELTSADLMHFGKAIAKWNGFTLPEDSAVLDLNCDGKVNPLDLVYLARHLADWEDYKVLPIVK